MSYVYFGGSSVNKWLPGYVSGGYGLHTVSFTVNQADTSTFSGLQNEIESAKDAGKLGVVFCDSVVTGVPKVEDKTVMQNVFGYIVSNTTSSDENAKKYWATEVRLSGVTVTMTLQASAYGQESYGTLESAPSGGTNKPKVDGNLPTEDKERMEKALNDAMVLTVVKS